MYDEERIDAIASNMGEGEHYVQNILASLAGQEVTVVAGDGMLGVIDQEGDLYVLFKT